MAHDMCVWPRLDNDDSVCRTEARIDPWPTSAACYAGRARLLSLTMSRKRRQIVLVRTVNGQTLSLGTAKELQAVLQDYNMAPDGSNRPSMGTQTLYGPGLVVEVSTSQDEIMQAMVSVSDEEIAWPVLSRLCKAKGWKMTDIETGHTFG